MYFLFPRTLPGLNCVLKGLDDYMILDEQAFKIGTSYGILLV